MMTNGFFCLNKKGGDLGKNHLSEDAQAARSNKEYKVHKWAMHQILFSTTCRSVQLKNLLQLREM
jgi:hypothetical protein